MAWPGYFSFAGTEIINSTRTEAYARHMGAGWFRPVYNQPELNWLLEDPPYSSPLQDDAPWADPGNLDSYDFYGVYPLDVTGIEDSTYEANVTESTLDGGYVGRRRRKTRAVVFSALLIGASECAVMYGMHWLRVVLGGGPCFGKAFGNCSGGELCFLACPPCKCDSDTPDDCNLRYGHSLHNVTTTVGPNVTAKTQLMDGGRAWTVTWTMTAANPIEFGAEYPLIAGFLDPAVNNPYVGGVTPDGGGFDDDGFVQTEPACPVVSYTPVYDPTCSLLVPPPGVPSPMPTCFNFPVNYLRRNFVIPRGAVPLWGDVVPILTLTTGSKEIRNTRIRFYADVFDTGNPSSDPCNYCGDLVITYMPPSSTLVIDGTDKLVYMDAPGQGRRRADAIISDSTGNPFEWPELSCGFGYVVTVDTPQHDTVPIVDLSLVPRVG